MARWMETKSKDFGTYNYMQQLKDFDDSTIRFDYMHENNLCIVGDVDTCIEKVKRYQDVGLDSLLCYHQGYGIPLDKVRRSIERFGKAVIPAFS